MTHSFHPISRPPTEVGFFMPIYPGKPTRRGDPRGDPRSPSVGGRRPRRPVLPCFLCPRRAGCPHPAARPCTALPAGHTGPALQKYCVPSRADRVVRPYNSATGGAMWASPPTKFYHSSVRRCRRQICTVLHAKTLSLRGRSAPVATRIPRPLLHAKKEDASLAS